MLKEIGSEFWEVNLSNDRKHEISSPHQLLMTGRTALDFIIRDAKEEIGLKTVYMPAYCCHTMIQPFLENGITVLFYSVNFENGKFTYDINFDTRCDAVLILQYFGYCNDAVGQIIDRFSKRGITIIEDASHSWFSGNPYSFRSDYVFASFRKWTGLPCGAIAIKKAAPFAVAPPTKTNSDYLSLRLEAENRKKQYIEEDIGQKDIFLQLFNQAEILLENDYRNYGLPQEYEDAIARLDYEYIRSKRKENAVYLTEGIKHCKGIECVSIANEDVPLFVPIMVTGGRRSELRKKLIENAVYCPVHWPLSELHDKNNTCLFENCLSLVCDQRYTTADMGRIIAIVNEFCGGYSVGSVADNFQR